jgi:LPPG:FO 2-phospho-L-lactate transferase
MKVVLLCGGVGGSKLALGFYSILPPNSLTLICNTGDDLQLHGLNVSPDLDTVTYTLSGRVNPETGWGLNGDSFEVLGALEKLGEETWFRIGDRDLATHLVRTSRLREGYRLTEVSEFLARKNAISASIVPMCDEPVRTEIRTEDGWLAFQEYFVLRRWRDTPLDVRYRGVEAATITPEARSAIESADLIVFGPSNPVLSVMPILAVPGVRASLTQSTCGKVAVSPFIGSRAITGPADALMRTRGIEPTSSGLAEMYEPYGVRQVLAHQEDRETLQTTASSAVTIDFTDTLMPNLEEKMRLAREVIAL